MRSELATARLVAPGAMLLASACLLGAPEPCDVTSDCGQGVCVEGFCRVVEPRDAGLNDDAGHRDGGAPLPLDGGDAGDADSGRTDRDGGPRDGGGVDGGGVDGGGVDGGGVDGGGVDGGLDGGGVDGGLDGGVDVWHAPDLQSRVRLRFIHTRFGGDLTFFPVLVKLDPARVDLSALQLDASDLAFVDDSGTVLPYDIELWDPNTLRMDVWVRVPTIPGRQGQAGIWMYYQGAPFPRTSTPADVWDEYKAVYNMGGEGAGTSNDEQLRWESTGNEAPFELRNGSPQAVPGLAGMCMDIDIGDEQWTANLDGENFPAPGTLSLLLMPENIGASGREILDRRRSNAGTRYFVETNNDDVVVNFVSGSSSLASRALGAEDNRWVALAITHDLNGNVAVMSNGVYWTTGIAEFLPDTMLFHWAAQRTLDARLDQLWVRPGAMSQAWLYAQQASSLDAFVSIQPEARQVYAPQSAIPSVGTRLVEPVWLWDFEAPASPSTVIERNGSGIDLMVQDPSATEWIDGALVLRGPTTLSASLPPDLSATPVTACSGGDFSVELWLHPDNSVQHGPATILTMQQTVGERNLLIGQGGRMQDDVGYVTRARTTFTDNDGRYPAGAAEGQLSTAPKADADLTQLVLVRDATSGAEKIQLYVNDASTDLSWPGTTTNWGAGFTLAVGDDVEQTGNLSVDEFSRPWLGAIYSIAIYCAALDAPAVNASWLAGPF